MNFKRWLKLLFVLFLIVVGYCTYQFWSVMSYGNIEPEKADVIIVLGAAVWEKGPSPALLARIHHAKELYTQGYANYFILSGGQGIYGPPEARAMADVLMQNGIDENNILLEDQSTNTKENLRYSKALMDKHGFESAIIVTDTFHMKRALLMAEDFGLHAYGSAAKESILNQNPFLKLYYTLREVLAITAYYLFH